MSFISLTCKVTIGIIFICCSLLVVGPIDGTLQSSDWRPLGKDIKDCLWFYDASGVRHLPGNKMMVWLKRMINDDERAKTIQKRSQSNLPLNGYDEWAYEMGLMELNCENKTIRQLSVIDYDQKGKSLRKRSIEDNLSVITIDSIGDMTYRILCVPDHSDDLRKNMFYPPLP
jgi:hypothetical protein